MVHIPIEKKLLRGKKSQETVQGFLQQQRVDFQCQKQTFQIVLPQNMFHKIDPAKQIHLAH